MARGRSLTQFQEAFPDEAACAAFLFERRWPGGFTCPSCGRIRVAVLRSRAHTYECLDCGRQTSITAGTVMHRSKLPLTVWFSAAHLMSTHSNGMSARQLEDQLGLTYKTAWLLAQKLRRSMVDPDRDALEGVVEVDQAEIPFRAGDTFFDPGNAGKILIAGAVEVIDRDTNEAKPRRKGRQIPRHAVRPHPPCNDRGQFRGIDRGLRASQREARNDIAHRRSSIVSRIDRLPARPARGWQNGGACRAAMGFTAFSRW